MNSNSVNLFSQVARSDFGITAADRQRDVTLLSVVGTDPRPEISVAQLQKNFSSTGLTTEDVTLQVKEFSFHCEFPNVFEGDELNFWVSTRVLPAGEDIETGDTTTFQYSSTDEPFKVKLIIPSQQKRLTVTSYEFVKILNDSIFEACRLFYLEDTQYTVSGPNRNKRLCTGFFANSKFCFDAAANKIKLVIQQKTRLMMWKIGSNEGVTVGPDTEESQSKLYDALVLVQTSPGQIPTDQYRLANMIGLNANGSPVNQLIGLYTHEYYNQVAQFQLDLGYPSADPDFSKMLPQGVATYYSPHMSDAVPVKFLTLRSNTRSNVMFSDGHGENVLATYAITHDATSLYQTMREDTNLYAIRDTIQGVRHIQLEIVDENGTPLFFRVPYSLKIAVFFN